MKSKVNKRWLRHDGKLLKHRGFGLGRTVAVGARLIEEGDLAWRVGISRRRFVKVRLSGRVQGGVHWGRVGKRVVWTEDGVRAVEVLWGLRLPAVCGGAGKEGEVKEERVASIGLVYGEEEGVEEVMGVVRANYLNGKVVRCMRAGGIEDMVRVRDAREWEGRARNGGMKGIRCVRSGGIWWEKVKGIGEQETRWKKGLDGVKLGEGGRLVIEGERKET